MAQQTKFSENLPNLQSDARVLYKKINGKDFE